MIVRLTTDYQYSEFIDVIDEARNGEIEEINFGILSLLQVVGGNFVHADSLNQFGVPLWRVVSTCESILEVSMIKANETHKIKPLSSCINGLDLEKSSLVKFEGGKYLRARSATNKGKLVWNSIPLGCNFPTMKEIAVDTDDMQTHENALMQLEGAF